MMDSFRDTAYEGFASMLFDPGRGINLRLNTESPCFARRSRSGAGFAYGASLAREASVSM
jgi:hypothetical protein